MPRVTRPELEAVFRQPRTLRAVEEVINGAVVIGDAATGATAATLGAAKPGTATEPIWLQVEYQGAPYLLALWPMDV